MSSPIVNLRKDIKRKDGLSYVEIRMYFGRKRVRLTVKGVVVHPKDWDEKRCRVKRSRKDWRDINLMIDQELAKINTILVEARLRQQELSSAEFLQAYRNPGGRQDFVAYMEDTINREFMLGNIKEVTRKKHVLDLRKLKQYLMTKKKKTLLFSELTTSELTRIDLWHIELLHKKGLDGRSARRHMLKHLKKYTRLAILDGHEFKDPWLSYKMVKEGPSKRDFCTQDELKALLELYYGGNPFMTQPLRIVLRSFLAMCFTGLRFGDSKKLGVNDYNAERIALTPTKTETTSGVLVVMPVCAPLRRILKDASIKEDRRWVVRYGKLKEVPLFPTLSEPKTNKYLKQLAKMARIKKPLSTKAGRHTFATIFLENGGTPATLQKLLGHKSIKSTMVYVHITDKQRKNELHNAFDKF